MNKVVAFVFTLQLLLAACSHISEDERLIYVKPAPVSRNVLLEDFTGQRCVNCPNANEEIARLQNEYGADVVIAVGIHSGPLGFYTNSRYLGLRTKTGDEYYDHWQLEYQPIGMIDRQGQLDYSLWSGRIRQELEKTAPVSIALEATVTDLQLHMKATVQGIDGNTDGKLQLWLTEDGVTAFQLMPDGTRNDAYVHQHVFRTAVNGTWGDSLGVKEGETVTRQYDMTLSDEWNVDGLSVVAFIYNDAGVQQVTKVKLKKE